MTTDNISKKTASADLLRQALGHLEQGRLQDADALLAMILDDHPDDADALQLMGGVRRVQQREPEAEQLYRRSLAINPAQPHVHHNMGNLLRRLGRPEESMAAQKAAIALIPNYAEAYLGLGLALLDVADREKTEGGPHLKEAEANFRRALHLRPALTDARKALAVALNGMERPKEAEAILLQLLAAKNLTSRQVAELQFNLGVSAALQDRHNDALALYDAAQGNQPDIEGIHYNRATALQNMGMMERAKLSYSEAIANSPFDMRAHRDLNHLLYRLGDDANFLRSYDDAMAHFPNTGVLHLAKANFLFQKEDFAAAKESFEQALFFNPQDYVAQDGLALVLARQGDFAGAIARHEQAASLRPQAPAIWVNFAETLLRSGDAPAAAQRAQTARDLQPFHQGAVSMQATAFAAMDDARAEQLSDYEGMVRTFEIAPPAGYSDMESFNRDLMAYLDTMHRDRREMVDQTLRSGTQTAGHLFGRNRDLVERLRVSIEAAAAQYIGDMADDAQHPLFGRKSRNFGYSGSWSTRLNDCGFHTNHYHGKGWISSAYYVSVPDAVNDGDQGWIKFGEPSFDAGLRTPVRRTIKPKVGTLILFPSYMWHGTNPFHSPQQRMSVAFDIVPKQS